MTFITKQATLSWTERLPFIHNDVMIDTLGSLIRSARKQRGLVMRQVAEAVGVSVQAVGQWERGENDLTMDNLRAVAAFLKFDLDMATRGELRLLDTEADPLNEVERVTDVGHPNFGPKDVPVNGTAWGGDDADFEMNGQIVDYVRRPPGIAHLKGVFALHVLGTSMVPRFEPGDLLYCGGRDPVPGDDIVIELHPTEQALAGKGYIKRFIRRDRGKVVVRQYNPAKDLSFDAASIKRVHRVIPLRELLGF